MQKYLSATLDLLFPRSCQFCAADLPEKHRGVICDSCLHKVEFIEAPYCQRCSLPFEGDISGTFVCSYCSDIKFHFESAVAACRASGVVRDAIHRYKYNEELYFQQHLVDWLLTASRSRVDWSSVDFIVPVPLHPRKRRERGFNQAEQLAVQLGRLVDKPIAKRVVKRVKDTETQTRLDAAHRRQNLRNAFLVRDPAAVDGRRMVLLDDVFTTGATLDACAKVLTAAGARSVIALTAARGI